MTEKKRAARKKPQEGFFRRLFPRYENTSVDLTFLVMVILLLVFGLVMMFSASYAQGYYREGNSYHYIVRQLAWAALGLLAMFLFSRMDYHVWRKLALASFPVVAGLLIACFFMPPVNEARRWIFIGNFQFQPSELAKMAVVIYFSATISKKREKMQTWSQGIWPYVLILGVIALLMMREPHLSGTILIVCTGIVLMIVGGIKGWLIPLGIGGVGLVGTLYVILVQKGILHYGENRINTWRDPFNAEWYRGDGWQIAQCLIAIGSGGLLGVGLGKGRQKFLYLPEEHNDCIFAVICEELGLVGACVIMLVFALLILRGFWIALHARDRFGALLVVGFMTLTGLQTFLNIAVVTGLVPATGISLPFFSYGGTALLCQLAEMGIVLSVSRQMPAPENG